MEKKLQQTAGPKSYNVRIGPEQVAWLESVKMGNASTIIRAGVWWLSLQEDHQDIIRAFERLQAEGIATKHIPPGLGKTLAQQHISSHKGKKKE